MAIVQTTELPFGRADAQRLGRWVSNHWPTLLLVVVLVLLPAIANSFILDQIVGWSLILGTIALPLMFLAGYGGMVSLAQMSVAGVAGYMIAVFGTSSLPKISLFWPWW